MREEGLLTLRIDLRGGHRGELQKQLFVRLLQVLLGPLEIERIP